MAREFGLSEQDVLDLPVDELALEVLRDVVANEEWNSGNWMVLAAQSYGPPALNALSEAWGWLLSKGLVVDNLEKQNSLHAILVTRLGHQVADEGLTEAKAIQRLAMDLHPELEAKVRRQYLMGEYELATLAAMKAVEVRVRTMSEESSSALGVKLMRSAFGAGGPLCDPSLDGGEQTARMDLFAGAIGLFKNPTSHRDVEYENPAEAAEVILLADLLMRILDGVQVEVDQRQAAENLNAATKEVGEFVGTLIRPRPDE